MQSKELHQKMEESLEKWDTVNVMKMDYSKTLMETNYKTSLKTV